MTYEKRIADDWISTYSHASVIDDFRDPLIYIEIVVDHEAAYGWSILSEVFERDIEGTSLPMLVAGPFDSWIKRHSGEWIEFLTNEARSNPRVKWALGGISRGTLEETVWRRLKKARGPVWPSNEVPLPPPPRRSDRGSEAI